MINRTSALLIFLFLAALNASAQIPEDPYDAFSGQFEPRWQAPAPIGEGPGDGAPVYAMQFEHSVFDEEAPVVPYYAYKAVLLEGETLSLNDVAGRFIDVGDGAYEAYTHPSLFECDDQEWYPKSPVVLGKPYYTEDSSGRPVRNQKVFFYPFQLHRSGDVYRIHSRVNYRLQKEAAPVASDEPAQSWAEASRLRKGSWYKFPVDTSGVYKITGEYLASAGIDLEEIRPAEFQVFGHAEGMLPQLNTARRDDDLTEIPLELLGTDDGSFDEDDYALFYAGGPDKLFYDSTLSAYRGEKNLYATKKYCFFTFNQEPGARIQNLADSPGSAEIVHETLNAVRWHEQDRVNLMSMGRLWLGEEFDRAPTRDYAFETDGATGDGWLNVKAFARSGAASSFHIYIDNQIVETLEFEAVKLDNDISAYARHAEAKIPVPASAMASGRLNVRIQYNQDGDGQAWIDFVSLEYPQRAGYYSGGAIYKIPAGDERNAGVRFSNLPAEARVWAVTTPGTSARLPRADDVFLYRGNEYAEVIVFTPPDALEPAAPPIAVANQNLHAAGIPDYIMVSHPDFLPRARILAEFHAQHYDRNVLLVTTEQVYNEFSSGAPDATAIRNFVKMFYDRANAAGTAPPEHLLLVGDGSYDNRGIRTAPSFVPTYEARESLYSPQAFVTDDYYALLEDGNGFWGERVEYDPTDNRHQKEYLDIAVGRLPVKTLDEAEIVIDKIINYAANPESFGDWRNKLLLVGDFKLPQTPDGYAERMHITQSETLDREILQPCQPKYNVDKIYLDSYPVVSKAEGNRYPKAQSEMMDLLQSGQLLVNYVGHGGEVGLSTYYIFELPELKSLKNAEKLPLWVTATCEFGRWDDPDRTSGAEHLVIHEGGGAMGIMTAVRKVYSSRNSRMNQSFFNYLFGCVEGSNPYPTLGEAFMHAKNVMMLTGDITTDINTRSFSLLADPGIKLVRPELNIEITKINGRPVAPSAPDTIKALARTMIEGEVRTEAGVLRDDFNGQVDITVYDKPLSIRTLSESIHYEWQKNRIFYGSASVRNGKFELTFTAPLDIAYQPGFGKISAYAYSEDEDASGFTNQVVVCCTDESAEDCDHRPEIELYMENEQWQDGSLVGSTPTLVARVKDERGINMTGLGVGRNLTAVLNDNPENPIILDDYYESNLDDPTSGLIRYRLDELPAGEHKLYVKVWNVCNMSNTDTVVFRVASPDRVALDDLRVYPNPFSDVATFKFTHNQLDTDLQIHLELISSTGQKVAVRSATVPANSNVAEISWDGADDSGAKLPAGVFFYRLTVRSLANGATQVRRGKLISAD